MASIRRILIGFGIVLASVGAVTFTASGATATSEVVKPAATAGLASPGTYHPVSPTRLLDTRYGIGAPKGPLGPHGVVHVVVTDTAGVPSAGVSAVVLNVTETSATTGGYMTVFPTGTARPTTSSLNFPRNRTVANSVTVAVGPTGSIDIYNNAGNAQAIVDISGYFVGDASLPLGGFYFPTDSPVRLLDTREGGVPLPAHTAVHVEFDVNGLLRNPNAQAHVRAFAVNITAVDPQADGYLSAWDGTSTRPQTSTLNFMTGATVPNMAIVPTAMCVAPHCELPALAMAVYNGSSKPTHVIVDLLGVFDDGTLFSDTTVAAGYRFHPITPTRLVDTRTGLGGSAALGPAQTATFNGKAAVLNPANALALNVTAVGPTKSTYLTLWMTGAPRPTASTLNPTVGQTVANAAITATSAIDATSGIGSMFDSSFDVYNRSGITNVVIDVTGYYVYEPPQ